MPEEGFSFLEIQTPMENLTPKNQKTLRILQILKPPLFFRPKMANPPITGGGGGGWRVRSYGRLGPLPFKSVTRKVRENTRK